MRRPILSTLLLVGATAGFVSGAHHVFGHGHHPFRSARREAFENHVADVCVRAARREGAAPPPGTPR